VESLPARIELVSMPVEVHVETKISLPEPVIERN
jgi:hypothetical protein